MRNSSNVSLERHVREQLDRLLEAAAVEGLGADLALDPLHLALERVAEHRRRHLAAVVELRLEMQPLPDLGAGDLGGRRVLHQIVERHGAAARAARPRYIARRRGCSRAGPPRCACPRGPRAGRPAVTCTSSRSFVELVRPRHQPVEHLHRDRHEVGMGDPGAVVAVAGLALLVGAHLGEGRLVGGRCRP